MRGLYAIADTGDVVDDSLLARVRSAMLGGARLVQYRDKGSDRGRRRQQSLALSALCRAHGVPLIINDDVALAAEVDAAGVHVGKDDPSLASARKRLGNTAIIGVSCYDRLDLALAAAREGADYVAFGSFFPSPTKPEAVPASIDLLRSARRELALPIVAIGGITPANGADLIAAGADCLAVISGVFAQPDIRAAAQAYTELFTVIEQRRRSTKAQR
jgi:thiamine-phosphate pyrophosphorylase